MTERLIDLINCGTVKPSEIAAYPLSALCALSSGTTPLHQLMLVGADRIVRAIVDRLSNCTTSECSRIYATPDSDGNTPLHTFALRCDHSRELTSYVIERVPLHALQAVNKQNNTPLHLFPLVGNRDAMAICQARDNTLAQTQNALMQTPVELSLQRRQVETERELNTLRRENKRLTHNLIGADDEETKFKDFYRRAGEELLQRQKTDAEVAARMTALEAARANAERVMREALAKREAAERDAKKLADRLNEMTAEQTRVRSAEQDQVNDLSLRETELQQRSAALEQAVAEIEEMRSEVGTEQSARIAQAEERVVLLTQQVEQQTRQRNEAAANLEKQRVAAAELETQLAQMNVRTADLLATAQRASESELQLEAELQATRAQTEATRREFEDRLRTLDEERRRTEEELRVRADSKSAEAQKLEAALADERAHRERRQRLQEESDERLRKVTAELLALKLQHQVPRAVEMPTLIIPRTTAPVVVTSTTSVAAANGGVDNSIFFANVVNRTVDGDNALLSTLFSQALDLNPNTTDAHGSPLLEIVLKGIVKNYRLYQSSEEAAFASSAAGGRLARAPEVLSTLLRAGATWDGLTEFVESQQQNVPKQVLEILKSRDSLSPFFEALLCGDGVGAPRDAVERLVRHVSKMGSPNHIPTLFSKLTHSRLAGHGYTYVHIAIELYKVRVADVVETLMRPGINLTLADARGRTALHFALQKLHSDAQRCVAVVTLLLANGANPQTPCIDTEFVAEWAAKSAEQARKLANPVAAAAADEVVSRIKRFRPGRLLIGSQRREEKEVQDAQKLAADARQYATPVAMARAIGNERLCELLTQQRFRYVETSTITDCIHSRAILHSMLLQSFRSGELGRELMLARIFESVQHVFFCFNPYIRDSAIIPDSMARRQPIRDQQEQHVIETLLRRIEEPAPEEPAPLASVAETDDDIEYEVATLVVVTPPIQQEAHMIDPTSSKPPPLALPPALSKSASVKKPRPMLASKQLARSRTVPTLQVGGKVTKVVAEQYRVYLTQLMVEQKNGSVSDIYTLAQQLLKMLEAIEERFFDVDALIERSAIERYPVAVRAAIKKLIDEGSAEALEFVAGRKDALFGNDISYQTVLEFDNRERMNCAQMLASRGEVSKLEWLIEHEPELLDRRPADGRSLVAVAIASKQPHIIVLFDYRMELRRRQRREQIAADENTGTDDRVRTPLQKTASRHSMYVAGPITFNTNESSSTTTSEMGVDGPMTAEACKAPNREHYSLLTRYNSTVLHVLMQLLRDDLLQFALPSVQHQLSMVDDRGCTPLQTALARQKHRKERNEADTRALERCVSMLRGDKELPLPLNEAQLKEALKTPRQQQPPEPEDDEESASSSSNDDVPEPIKSPRGTSSSSNTPRKHHRHHSSSRKSKKSSTSSSTSTHHRRRKTTKKAE